MDVEKKHKKIVKKIVKKIKKRSEDIRGDISDRDSQVIYAWIQLSDQVEDLLDAIKNVIIYKQDADYLNITEELNNIEFSLGLIVNNYYLEQILKR